MIVGWIVVLLILMFGFVVFFGAPYVPTHKKQVKRALTELYHLTSQDVLVDVGSGDGIVLRTAARLGARAVGYELNPLLVLVSRLWGRRYSDHMIVLLADFWRTPFPAEATVVYAFMVSRDIVKMTNKLQAEANRLGRPLAFIIYGMTLPSKEPVRQLGAHSLYTFSPLQPSVT